MPVGKRDEICDAALHLFVEKGIAATTTREIAKRARTAEGNLYRYFKSKDHIARFVFELCASRLMASLVHAVDDREDPPGKLEALIRGMFRFSRKEPEAFRFILMSHHAHLLKLDELYPKSLPKELFVDVLRAGVERGDFRPTDPVLATGWIVGMTQRAILILESGGVGIPAGRVVDETVRGAILLVSAD